jgi:hypothetical protein
MAAGRDTTLSTPSSTRWEDPAATTWRHSHSLLFAYCSFGFNFACHALYSCRTCFGFACRKLYYGFDVVCDICVV